MEAILGAVGVMLVLGVCLGGALAYFSRKLAVEEDPRVDQIAEALPGINCGACGYGGCKAYAEALVSGGEEIGKCIPGGEQTARTVADILGVEVKEIVKMKARVHCQGGRDKCGERFKYFGVRDCGVANAVQGGPKACEYGCLGLGTCAETCPFGAITISEQGLPVIDDDKCTGCGLCTKVCPRNLIEVINEEHRVYLGCSNRQAGPAVKRICKVGCIACGVCAKNDPAIEMVDNLPSLDYNKGSDFRVAVEKCPMNCYVTLQAVEEKS